MSVHRSASCAAAMLLVAAAAPAGVDPGLVTAPRMDFVPPAPGSYRLERIHLVADAVLLDPGGRAVHLAALTRGKVTVLTFFYASCSDPLGCPYAYGTLHRVRSMLRPRLASPGQVRFVSVSLDPTHDTPEALAAYAGALPKDPALEWDVLTMRSVKDLLPVLADFGQDVSVETDARGQPTRAMHHMLKMFLIDRVGEVREIYSLAFLQPAVIANDISTLLLEGHAGGRRPGVGQGRTSGPAASR